ncbi:MAG: ClpXP protease specificity-enhancing factor SspB [Hyphomicrobium sp.]
MTAGPTIDYETLAQDAMRGVVRTVLQRAAKSGLPGDHHFYISFDTEAPGASISKRLKEKYPNEMTIVLQHRFWDLLVSDDRFEVKLTFDGIPERLIVPFASIKVFFDPSVRYGLQFEEPDSEDGTGTLAPSSRPGLAGDPRVPRAARKARTSKKPRVVERDNNDPAVAPIPMAPTATTRPNLTAAPTLSSVETPPKSSTEGHVSAIKSVDDKPANGGGAEIVSLDQFRKK